MAREFFKNLPNTTTPLTAPRMNALLDGDEAMGNIVVDSVRSKNLLSFGNWENTANNITCKSENGKITITGTYGSQTNFYRDCNLDLKAGTTYVISKNQSNSDQFYPYFILRSGETQVARVNNTDGYITYTPETDIHIDTIMLYINGASGVNCTLYPQVEIGTTPTDYSEYKEYGYVDSGWHDISLQNNITARNGDIYKPQYRRIGDIVYLKGQINIPQHSQLSAFQLPSGYRPAYEVKPPILNNYYDAWIAPNGILYIGQGNAETNIDMGVSFLAN